MAKDMSYAEALALVLAAARESMPDEDAVSHLSAETDAAELDAIADLYDAIAIVEIAQSLAKADEPAEEPTEAELEEAHFEERIRREGR